MTQADIARETQSTSGLSDARIAPGDALPATSVQKVSESICLTPEDQAFCETHEELIPWVKALRATEQILQAGRFPDEAEGNSDWPTMQLANCIGTLLEQGGVDAIPIVLRQAYATTLNFFTKSTHANAIAYMGMPDVYMGPCLETGKLNADDRYHRTIEYALQPLFYKRGGGVEEVFASRFLTYKGHEGFVNMRVIDRLLDDSHSFEYYGVGFTVDGLPEGGSYSVSELDIGVLGVHDRTNNKIVKIINIHPDRYNYQTASEAIHVSAIEPKELFRQILGRDVPGYTAGVAEKFLSHYMPFYHEEPYADSRITRFFDSYGRFGFIDFNANVLPLEAKYYLWKNLCEVSGYYDKTIAPKIYTLLNTYGPDVAWVVQAMNGDKRVLQSLVNALVREKIDSAIHFGIEPDQATADFFHAIARAEQYVVEAAYTVTASVGDTKGAHIQERINYLLPIARGMVREAVENGDLRNTMGLFTLGFKQYQKMLNNRRRNPHAF